MVNQRDSKEQHALFDEFKEEVILSSLKHWSEYRYYFIMQHIFPAVEHFGEVRKLNSQMNFYDLLL
jgi:hypothetical protein